jgi:hypothetical protein
MSKAVPHPHDEGKWACSVCSYGHGKGNGKSRNGVYKHWKKEHQSHNAENDEKEDFTKQSSSTTVSEQDNYTKSEDSPKEGDFVQTDESDYTKSDGFDWGSISWADDDETEEVQPRTIPAVFTESLNRPNTGLSAAGTKQILRMSYIGLDRLITHWGRGVMSNAEWKIERNPADYDALQDSTYAVMQHYGVAVNVSPVAAWAATVGAAYVPPVMHIQQNADPNRRGRLLGRIRGMFSRLRFRRRRRTTAQNPEISEVERDE